jgi:hypothetical protein
MRGALIDDPYLLADSFRDLVYQSARAPLSGQSLRSPVIDPTKKTLILLGVPQQSNGCSVNPTLYTPTNSTVVDNFNIYDAQLYNITGPLLGCTYGPPANVGGPGCILARIGDSYKSAGYVDRAIIGPGGIGGSSMADWATGPHYNRGPVLMKRLAQIGITPSTPGTIWMTLAMLGEQDNVLGTSQSSFQTSYLAWVANMAAAGFVGRHFITQQTWSANVTSTAVRAAQLAVQNGTTIFGAGDLDTLGSSDRQGGATGVHFTDAGAAAAAAIIVAAMHASGAPF